MDKHIGTVNYSVFNSYNQIHFHITNINKCNKISFRHYVQIN
jgi:hypothetical protein